MKNRFVTMSIDRKFFKTMTIVAVTFMMLLFLITSIFVYQHFLNLESKDSLNRLDSIAQQLNYYMTSVDNYSRTIIVNAEVQDLTFKSNRDPAAFHAMDQMNLELQMNRIIQSTPFIHSVSLYSAKGSLIATTAPYIWTEDLPSLHPDDGIRWLCRQQYSSHNKDEVIPVLSELRPFYNTSSGALLGYIEINIPEYKISDIYRIGSSAGSHTLITDSDGIIRSSDGYFTLDTPYRNFKAAGHHGVFPFTIQNHKIIFSYFFPELNWYLFSEISLSTFLRPLLSLLSVTLLSAVICILICIYVSHRTSKSITLPIHHLIKHTRKIRSGNWTPVKGQWNITEIQTMFEAFNEMITAQAQLKNDLIESERLKRKISLELLQQQVNPHFLYNTLDNIYSLAELDEKPVLLSTVMNLSTFYRMALSSGRFHISIEEELKITKAYLDIMQVRYFNKFSFLIDCPESLYQYGCLKLLLQPIVENSIYHGLKELSCPGYLSISVKDKGQSIAFLVADNGGGILPEKMAQIWNENRHHFGIRNIHQRMEAYYGSPYGLTIENGSDGGCLVTLIIEKQEVLSHG